MQTDQQHTEVSMRKHAGMAKPGGLAGLFTVLPVERGRMEAWEFGGADLEPQGSKD